MSKHSLSGLVFFICLLSIKCETGQLHLLMDIIDSASNAQELSVTGTSIAVIDSEVSCTAKFLHKTYPAKSLKYVWKTNACSFLCLYETSGGTSSSVTFVPSQFDAVLAGNYTIDVRVLNGTRQIGKGSHKFTLTDKLNGHLVLMQNPSYKPQKSTFSTNKTIQLHAAMTDKFSNLQGYNTSWKVSGPQIKTNNTKTTKINVSLTTPGQYVVQASVIALYNITDDLNFTHPGNRHMDLYQDIYLYDAIHGLNVVGDRHYTEKNNLTMIVECSGSPPFTFDVILRGPKNEIVERRKSMSNCCMLLLRSSNLTVAGIYTVTYDVHNLVSQHKGNITIDVVKPPDIASDDAVLILAIVIGIAAPAVIIYFYIKEHSKRGSIEAANFSFHPFSSDQGACARACAAFQMCCLRLCCWRCQSRKSPREMQRASSFIKRDFPSYDGSRNGISSSSPSGVGATSREPTNNSSSSHGLGNTGQRCSTPWLEQSSENPNTSSSQNGTEDRYQSHWLIENTSPISASGTSRPDLQAQEEDVEAWQPQHHYNRSRSPIGIL